MLNKIAIVFVLLDKWSLATIKNGEKPKIHKSRKNQNFKKWNI